MFSVIYVRSSGLSTNVLHKHGQNYKFYFIPDNTNFVFFDNGISDTVSAKVDCPVTGCFLLQYIGFKDYYDKLVFLKLCTAGTSFSSTVILC